MPAPWPLDEWDLDTPGHGPLPHGSGFCSLALGRDVNALPPLLPLLVPPAMSDLEGASSGHDGQQSRGKVASAVSSVLALPHLSRVDRAPKRTFSELHLRNVVRVGSAPHSAPSSQRASAGVSSFSLCHRRFRTRTDQTGYG